MDMVLHCPVVTVEDQHQHFLHPAGSWGYPWMGFEYPPGQPYGSWTSPPIPTFRKTSTLFWEPQRGQSFCSTSGAGSTISSSSGQVGLPRKKIRIEEVTDLVIDLNGSSCWASSWS